MAIETYSDLLEYFNGEIPLYVQSILWASPPETTVQEVREKINKTIYYNQFVQSILPKYVGDEQLDKFGELLDLEREEGEENSEYRLRLLERHND